MSTPYDAAAETYYMSGLWTVPVAGKNPPVAGATGYAGVVNAEKIAAWTDPDPDVRAAAGRYRHHTNIAVRHWQTLAIDVDHGYNDKDGVKHLLDFARRHALAPLPATWSSTARGDDAQSRQYFYNLPRGEQITFNTKPCEAVELCTWHHRYSIVYPSVHPDTGWTYNWYRPDRDGVPPTWGRRSEQIPRAQSFAVLPRDWLKALIGAAPDADRSVKTVELAALLETFPQGEPDHRVQELIDEYQDMATHVGHDVFKKAGLHALLLGREGHPGAVELFELLVARFEHYVDEARPGRAHIEVPSLVGWVTELAQQKPIASRPLGPRRLYRTPTPAEFMRGESPTVEDAAESLAMFLDTYIGFSQPSRLRRRIAWMHTDPPPRLAHHVAHVVREAIKGLYPARRGLDAITAAYRHHGGTDPTTPGRLLTHALDAVLSAKVSA